MSSTDEYTSDAESKRYKKPLTKRAILKKLKQLEIEKIKLKNEKKDALADIENGKKHLIEMGFSDFVEMFETIERLADDKNPRIRDFTINFIEKLNHSIN